MIDFKGNIQGINSASGLSIVSEPSTLYTSLLLLYLKKTKRKDLFGRIREHEEIAQYMFNPQYRICPNCGLIEQYVDENNLEFIKQLYETTENVYVLEQES